MLAEDLGEELEFTCSPSIGAGGGVFRGEFLGLDVEILGSKGAQIARALVEQVPHSVRMLWALGPASCLLGT